VVAVGSINVDLVLRVEELPAAGETVTGSAFERHGGGKGANQAVAAARAGAEVLFVGAVGDDDFGEQAVRELERDGIDTSRVARLAGEATGVALVIVDAAGENMIAVASGANAALSPELVQEALDGVGSGAVGLLSFEVPDAALVSAAQVFGRASTRALVINPAPARELPSELLELNPILTPNASEVRALAAGAAVDDAARDLAARTGAIVVVTLGAEGALLVSGGSCERFAAPQVEAADATGAGDAFSGVLAASLAQGHELRAAVRRAVAAGACSVQAHGARGGLPSREELDRLAG
jgi:ribokinase